MTRTEHSGTERDRARPARPARAALPRGPVWPMPLASSAPTGAADTGTAGLTRSQWLILLAVFCALHYGALLVSVASGNFDPAPNHDHVHVARQVLAQGYPTIAIWPPGFGYYIAGKIAVARALGIPYWTGKLWADLLLVLASGVLSTVLALRLTRNRFLAVVSGIGLVAAPLFAFATAEGLAVLLFEPLFLAALCVLVDALRRLGDEAGDGARVAVGRFAGFGALLGLSCLVRANPQFLIPVLAPLVLWIAWSGQSGTTGRRGRVARFGRAAARAGLAVGTALLAQFLVLLPWSLVQRATAGESGVFAAPVVYYAYFDGMRRHPGFEVSDALRADPDPPPLSLDGVVDFNREWLRRDPWALAKLYGIKIVRTWYLSDSGRWDGWILLLHAPWWILALLGAWRWLRVAPRDPAFWLVLLVVVYLWGISAAVSGLARYMAPVYGLLGLLAGVALLPLAAQTPSARTAAGAGGGSEAPAGSRCVGRRARRCRRSRTRSTRSARAGSRRGGPRPRCAG